DARVVAELRAQRAIDRRRAAPTGAVGAVRYQSVRVWAAVFARADGQSVARSFVYARGVARLPVPAADPFGAGAALGAGVRKGRAAVRAELCGGDVRQGAQGAVSGGGAAEAGGEDGDGPGDGAADGAGGVGRALAFG